MQPYNRYKLAPIITTRGPNTRKVHTTPIPRAYQALRKRSVHSNLTRKRQVQLRRPLQLLQRHLNHIPRIIQNRVQSHQHIRQDIKRNLLIPTHRRLQQNITTSPRKQQRRNRPTPTIKLQTIQRQRTTQLLRNQAQHRQEGLPQRTIRRRLRNLRQPVRRKLHTVNGQDKLHIRQSLLP